MAGITRKLIIREYDMIKLMNQALGLNLYYVGDSLYNRVEFYPLERDLLEKQALIYSLQHQGKSSPLLPVSSSARFVLNARHHLYNRNYVNWHTWWNSDGTIGIQSRKSNPVSLLGWGIFERYEETQNTRACSSDIG